MNCIGAIHLGLENEINDFAQLIGLLAAASMKTAGSGVGAFDLDGRAPHSMA
jgi:hypothetical protein